MNNVQDVSTISRYLVTNSMSQRYCAFQMNLLFESKTKSSDLYNVIINHCYTQLQYNIIELYGRLHE